MKTIYKHTFFFLCLVFSANLMFADDFTVQVKETENYQHLIYPIKPGNQCVLTVNVTNNREDTCKVTLKKSEMGEVKDWITISGNNISIPLIKLFI